MKLISTFLCRTGEIGQNNNLFGGVMLAWLDEAGGIYAAQICRSPNIVTLKMDEVIFKLPVRVKDQVRIYGKTEHIGNTSVSIKLEARRHVVEDDSEILVCSTKMLFVKINEDGIPIPVIDK